MCGSKSMTADTAANFGLKDAVLAALLKPEFCEHL
jgi:hypothetical protein